MCDTSNRKPAAAAVGLAAAAGAVWAVVRLAELAAPYVPYLAAVAVLAAGGSAAAAVTRFARLPAAGKRNYPRAVWARLRWRWLVRNLGLAYIDAHQRGRRPVIAGTSVQVEPAKGKRLRYPRAKIRPDAYGLAATVKTIPGRGRTEFEAHADHFADAWRCVRVQVSQPRPGRLIVRGLRTDPLTEPYPEAAVPPGILDPAPDAPWRLYSGRDQWGAHRYRQLAGLTGITVGGLPGYGKTSLINSWLCQLAPRPVKFVIIDGKGGGDFTSWEPRAEVVTDDNLADAAAALEDAHAEMRRRLGDVRNGTGPRNAWHRGPTPDLPLLVVIVDECHTFFDLDAVKGDKEAEQQTRTCRTMAAQLVKKGRSVLVLTLLITQKQTGDAIPTAIRDNCGFGLSFATKTTDAAVAALGEGIRAYPSYCPTTLQAVPDYIGVATAALPTGSDPFVQLRVPQISEESAAARALASVAASSPTSADRVRLAAVPNPAGPGLIGVPS